MISIPKHLSTILNKAAIKAMPALTEKITVTPERNKDWDYTCPSAMKIYNMTKKNGSFGFSTCQELAQAIVNNLDQEANDAIQSIELKQAGGGDPAKSGFFMNIQLKDEFIEKYVNSIIGADNISIAQDEEFKKQRVIVDFSSPNIAKDMHVGHLRSTIIGDSICRVLEFLGHDVLRMNHLGDWGTQFGMLIAELNDEFPDFLDHPPPIQDLVVFYKRAKKRFDSEEDFKKISHENVVKLQQGDERTFKGWQMLCSISEKEFQRIYDRLDIKLESKGESFYNPLIKPMLEDLESRQLITISDGASCVFVPKRKVPLMVKKSDGGYGYDTTDITAMRYRTQEQHATWIVYVTDEGQKLHFDTVYDAAKLAGYIDPAVTRYDHVGFGLVLQVQPGEEEIKEPAGGDAAKKDGKKGAPAKAVEGAVVPKEEEKKGEGKKADEAKKPKIGKMKTREGDSTKLMDLLDEAKNRTLDIFKERMKEDEDGEGTSSKVQVDLTELEKTAETMGISSVKYYDLKQNRTQNYVFAFDKMLDPRGNTGVYLLYMYVRVLSIMRKGAYETEVLKSIISKPDSKFKISNKSERELAIALLRLPEQIELAMTDLQLNRLTDQLYEIAVKIGEFYQQTKVLGSDEEISRILLLEATRKIMHVLFHLLGMKTIERI